MRTISYPLKTVFSLFVCLAILCGTVLFPGLQSAAAVNLTATAEVSGDTVTVKVAFPEVTLASVSVDVTYNASHMKLSSEATYSIPSGPMCVATPMATANAQGKCSFAIAGMADLAFGGSVFTLVFHVEDGTVEQTSVGVTVTKCKNASVADVELDGTTKSITLKTPTPPPPPPVSSSTTSSSGTQDSDETIDSGSVSDSSSNSNSSSDSSSNSNSNSGSGSTKTSDKVSSGPSDVTDTTDTSDTVSSAPVTDDVTDSETGFPFSSGSGTASDGSSDVTDGPVISITNLPGYLPSDTLITPPVEEKGVDSGTLVIISVSIAAFLCCGLTLLAFLRRAPRKTDEE